MLQNLAKLFDLDIRGVLPYVGVDATSTTAPSHQPQECPHEARTFGEHEGFLEIGTKRREKEEGGVYYLLYGVHSWGNLVFDF